LCSSKIFKQNHIDVRIEIHEDSPEKKRDSHPGDLADKFPIYPDASGLYLEMTSDVEEGDDEIDHAGSQESVEDILDRRRDPEKS